MSCTKHVPFIKWYFRIIVGDETSISCWKNFHPVDETNEQFSKNDYIKFIRHHEMFEFTF